jgi:hypothetical protein
MKWKGSKIALGLVCKRFQIMQSLNWLTCSLSDDHMGCLERTLRILSYRDIMKDEGRLCFKA